MTTESKKKLISSNDRQRQKSTNDNDAEKGQNDYNICQADEYILTDTEKRFLLAAERGDCATVQRMIEEFRDDTKEFSINCVDPLNRSALISAIENENFELIRLLLEEGIYVGDALLHAISEEYVEAVEELLIWEENHHVGGQLYSWEAVDRSKSNFTADITPLILAAHRNNYEILKVLLDRGATLPMPHDVKCGCDECVKSQETDSLRHSQSRINSYRALSASSLIALSSRDPVLSAFQLSFELKHLQVVESEFRSEYKEMRQSIQDFVSSLLDHARTSTELEIMLNYNHEAVSEIWMPGDRQTLDRLKLAIKYKQKNFVAHPNVQQLLAAIWYDGLPGFRRKTTLQQIKQVIQLGCSFPIYSMNYIVAPNSEKGKLMTKPFVKFIMHSTSYMFFLMLLGASSLRIIPIIFEMIGFPWMLDILNDWKKHERGSLPGPIELGIILYIISLIFEELKTLYEEGLLEYISDLWNIVDFVSNQFYVTWILMRTTAWIIAHRDLWYRGINPYFAREHWHPFDPMLIAEGAFAAGMIFSFLKLIHIFSINPHLGPLQVSLGRMIIDIIKFFFIYTLVLFAFGCGLNQLLWYYADLEKHKCYHLHRDVPDFDDQEKACTIYRRFANLFETSQSLFWASFGLVDLVSFDLAGIKGFTRFWALLLFGSYSVINIIVLLNMLIAMMSNSYQVIYEKSDTEWKFARSQLWMSYFEDGGTLPPPFNMCPSMKFVQHTLGRNNKRTKSIIRRALEKAQTLHDTVMRLLVRRYVTAEQRKRDDFGITEDDIIEVRQDISTFRYELLDILNKNNMQVPDIDRKQNAGTKKGKVMERRIMKDFQIGIVEKIASEIKKEGGISKDIFSTIAKAIGKKKEAGKDRDWNAIVRQNTISSNPIGSARSSIMRRSQRSLRRKILEEANAGLDMDTDILVELNPKLSGVTPTTRVAYVKFMQKTLTKREEIEDSKNKTENITSDSELKTPVADVKPEGSKILKQLSSSMKKASSESNPPSSSGAAATKSSNVANSNAPLHKESDSTTPKPNTPSDSRKGKAPSPPPSLGGRSEESTTTNGAKNITKDAGKLPSTSSDASDKKSDKSIDEIKNNSAVTISKPTTSPSAASSISEENKSEAKSNKKADDKNDIKKVPSSSGESKASDAGTSTDRDKTCSGNNGGENKNSEETDKKPLTCTTASNTSSSSSNTAATTVDKSKENEKKDRATVPLGKTAADIKSSATASSSKPEEKKSDGKTDKKTATNKPPEESRAGAGATGDRGKSTITGRIISGWL